MLNVQCETISLSNKIPITAGYSWKSVRSVGKPHNILTAASDYQLKTNTRCKM